MTWYGSAQVAEANVTAANAQIGVVLVNRLTPLDHRGPLNHTKRRALAL